MSTADASRGPVSSAGPTDSLWLRILLYCLAVTGGALVLAVGAAFFASGADAALSAVLGYLLVALFFGASLLVGHFVGRNNPSGALGIFLVTYVIKVVGFAGVLFFLGAPDWLDRTWFFASAVGTVVLWQVVEVFVFSRSRHQIYNDDAASIGGGRVVNGRG